MYERFLLMLYRFFGELLFTLVLFIYSLTMSSNNKMKIQLRLYRVLSTVRRAVPRFQLSPLYVPDRIQTISSFEGLETCSRWLACNFLRNCGQSRWKRTPGMTGLGLSLSGKFRSSAKLCQPAARVCFDHVLQSAMGVNVLAGFVPTRGGLAYIICTYISLIH